MRTCTHCGSETRRIVEKEGECTACYYYRRRHGQPRPQHLIDSDRGRPPSPHLFDCDPLLCHNRPTETRLVYGSYMRLCLACAAEFDKLQRTP